MDRAHQTELRRIFLCVASKEGGKYVFWPWLHEPKNAISIRSIIHQQKHEQWIECEPHVEAIGGFHYIDCFWSTAVATTASLIFPKLYRVTIIISWNSKMCPVGWATRIMIELRTVRIGPDRWFSYFFIFFYFSLKFLSLPFSCVPLKAASLSIFILRVR